ncbi:MAG: PIN domain-containing protein, partial [Pigmentiphaga sp.]
MPLPKLPTRPATVLSEEDIIPAKTPTPVKRASKKTTVVAAPADPVHTEAPTPVSAPPSAAPAVRRAAVQPRSRKPARSRGSDRRKLYVLDTNVLMHDPSSLFRFEEHDVYLPMTTLEELDNHKKGMSEVARNARQVSRYLDELVNDVTDIGEGIVLSSLGHRDATGKLHLQTTLFELELPPSLQSGKADNQILAVVGALQSQHTELDVVLVSKDINMRVKARTLGLPAEDYFNDQVLEDADLLYSGILALPEDFWDKHGKNIESWQQSGHTYYRVTGPLCKQFIPNQFVYAEGELPLYAQVKEISGATATLQLLRDYTHAKQAVWGITARNREQNFALNLLMNPDCDFVTLLGQAGTGKTLLALAAGLTQVLESKRYSEIIMTRVTVSVGEDIGFLPGTEEEKMLPWMGALEDNLEVLNQGASDGPLHGGDWGRSATLDLIRSKVKV